jgi:hypothetical protein
MAAAALVGSARNGWQIAADGAPATLSPRKEAAGMLALKEKRKGQRNAASKAMWMR